MNLASSKESVDMVGANKLALVVKKKFDSVMFSFMHVMSYFYLEN